MSSNIFHSVYSSLPVKTFFINQFFRAAALTILLLVLAVSPGLVFSQSSAPQLLTTITNPTPAAGDIFGSVVVGMGTDRVLVGAEGAAEAYLYKLDGTLVTTFTLPDPLAGSFGGSIAALGNDRVVIGAYSYAQGALQAGRVYLYRTNGTLLATFTNPSPASVQALGFSVTTVGNDRVLIGAGSGGPFLFATNGTLLTNFTKPTPGVFDNLPGSIAAVGNDRVLIGAQDDNTGASHAGAAYLFNTNGTLLASFTNPVPVASDNFGASVASLGNGQVLISSIDYGNAKPTGGAAYLFSTNGTLITTFTNPTHGYSLFGYSIAAVGSSRVLVGAYQDDTGVHQAGAAYLFSTNGALLNTFTNPTPEIQDWFAYSVAAVGPDQVIIGGVWDNTGAPDAGSAYVYGLSYPQLSIAQNASTVSLSWLTSEAGLILQQSDLLSPPSWSDTASSASINGVTNIVQQTIAGGGTNRFFRLRRP